MIHRSLYFPAVLLWRCWLGLLLVLVAVLLLVVGLVVGEVRPGQEPLPSGRTTPSEKSPATRPDLAELEPKRRAV